MLTSIFSKSKPVNFIIIAIVVIMVFLGHIYLRNDLDIFSFSYFTTAPIIVLFYVFLSDFIISKNDLTKKNSYGIMIFGITVIVFPEIFNHLDVLIANLLVIFALRRLFSLHTKRSLSKKFFDAVFWISLATLFHTWALLFLILVIVALANFWQSEIKHVVVSIFGMVTVCILLSVYNIVFNDAYFLPSNFDIEFSFDFSVYNTPYKILRLTILISIFLWSLIFYIKSISNKSRKQKPIHVLVIVSAFLGLIVALLETEKTGSEFIFFMVPFSIITANYLQSIKEKWFREIFVLLLLLVPLSKLFL